MPVDNQKFKVLTIPSHDDEKKFEHVKSFIEGFKLAKENKAFYRLMGFKSKREADIYIQGYLHGIGYLGEGLFYQNY